MDDDEVDFLSGPLDVLAPYPEVGQAVADPPQPQRARQGRRWPGMPMPAERTQDQHHAMIRVMNAARAKKVSETRLAKQQRMSEEQCEPEPVATLRDTLLHMACSTVRTVSSIAREHRISRTHVRDAMMGAAMMWQWSVAHTLMSLRSLVAQALAGARILIAWDYCSYDETQQRLSLKMDDLLSRDQLCAAWSILVSHRMVGWKLDSGHEQTLLLPQVPAVLVGHKTAGALWGGLHARVSKMMTCIYQFIDALREESQVSLSLRENDAASVCFKCNLHEARSDTRPLSSTMACGLHQTNLSVGPIVTALQAHALVLVCASNVYWGLFFALLGISCCLIVGCVPRWICASR